MHTQSFLATTIKIIESLDHPAIAAVEPFTADGVSRDAGVKVTMRDGRVIHLRATGTAGSKGNVPEIAPPAIPANLKERIGGKQVLNV